MKKKNVLKIVLLFIIILIVIIIFNASNPKSLSEIAPIVELIQVKIQGPTSTPTPKVYKLIDQYQSPTIKNKESPTIIFLGDSMTEALGENFDFLRSSLEKYYPKKVFGLFNYGYGSTNILSAKERLEKDTSYSGRNLPAILNRYFDIIIIESFGNNPLSEYPLAQGLQKQTDALDQMVAELVDTHPDSLIVFMATIAPSSLYGKGVVDLSVDKRIEWANERRSYIENHIAYAKKHNIPLINVYEKTLDKNGKTLDKYLNKGNYIHPSTAGVSLISQMVADYLFSIEIN